MRDNEIAADAFKAHFGHPPHMGVDSDKMWMER